MKDKKKIEKQSAPDASGTAGETIQRLDNPAVEVPQPNPEKEVTLEQSLSSNPSEMPQVQQGAVDAIRESEKNIAGIQDSKGVKFNAALHSTNEKGEPTFRKDGSFRSRSKSQGERNLNLESTQSQGDPKELVYLNLGQTMSSLSFGVMIALGGNDFAPRVISVPGSEQKFDESAMLSKGWADIARKYQWPDLPPWLALASIYTTILLPRLTMPVAVEKVTVQGVTTEQPISRWGMMMKKFKLWNQNRALDKAQKIQESKGKVKNDGI